MSKAATRPPANILSRPLIRAIRQNAADARLPRYLAPDLLRLRKQFELAEKPMSGRVVAPTVLDRCD